LTSTERLAELRRMHAEDVAHPNPIARDDPERLLYFLALIQPEDLPALKEEILARKEHDEARWTGWFQRAVLSAWAEHDAAGLEQWVIQADKGYAIRSSAFAQLAYSLAEREPATAWERCRRIYRECGEDPGFQDWSYEIARVLAQKDPRGMLHRILAGTAGETGAGRDRLVADAVGAMAERSFDEAIAMLHTEGLSPGAVNQARRAVLRSIWGPAPEFQKMSDFLLQDKGRLTRTYLPSLLSEWREDDPEACRKWMEAHAGQFTEDERIAVEYGEIEKRPYQEQLDWLLGREMTQMEEQTASVIFVEWSQKEPETALARLEKLEEGRLKDSAARQAVWALAKYDPQLALRAYGQVRGEALKAEACGSLIGAWYDYAPAAASTWLSEQPSGPARDGGIRLLLWNMDTSDPEASAHWAMQYSKEESRVNAAKRALRDWRKFDQPAAQAWLATQEFPEEARAELEKAVAGEGAPAK
jgi:hypothetical protein